jgi:hypothetical protein
MLTFLPFLLLLLLAFALQFITRSRLTLGNQWLILVLNSLLIWGAMLVLRSHLPAPVTVKEWFPIATNIGTLTFQLDNNSWTICFALISLLTAMILVETVKLHEKANLREWTRIILLVSLGVFGSLMNSLLAFILSWALLDIIELIVRVVSNDQTTSYSHFIFVLLSHLAGTILVIAALLINNVQGTGVVLSNIQGVGLPLLILGASFRMSFLPEPAPQKEQITLTDHLGNIRQMISPLLAMVFLSRLAKLGNASGLLLVFFLICVLINVYAAIKWFAVSDPLKGNSTWIWTFSGLALISTIKGYPESAVTWGLLMVTLGGWTWFYSYRNRSMYYLLIPIGLSLIGLPFSPSLLVMSGLNLSLCFIPAFLIVGIVRSSIKPLKPPSVSENWMKLFYMLGMALLTISPWLPGIWQLDVLKSVQYLGISILILFLAIVMLLFVLSHRVQSWIDGFISERLRNSWKIIASLVERIFTMDWLLELINKVYLLLRSLINQFNNILEGEGGLLWAFVFLALLISLLINVTGG